MFDSLLRRLKVAYASSSFFRKIATLYLASPVHKSLIRFVIYLNTALPVRYNLVIETANMCNASCVMCPYRQMKRAKSLMTDEIFDQIITRLETEKLPLNKVFFSGMGEPLVDRKILERIKQIKNLGLYVKLYTNASLLTKDIAKQIIALKVNELNISFNGADRDDYEKVMHLNFDKALTNIKYLLKVRNKNATPIIRISSVLTKENENKVTGHLSRWEKLVDSVGVSIAHEWGGQIGKVSDKITFEKTRVFPCRSLWHTLNIDSKGNFVVCCRDYESKVKLGHIQTHSFEQVIKHPILKKFQSLHNLQDIRKLPPMCRGCNFPFQEGIEWLMPRGSD